MTASDDGSEDGSGDGPDDGSEDGPDDGPNEGLDGWLNERLDDGTDDVEDSDSRRRGNEPTPDFDRIPDEATVLADLGDVSLTPSEHQRVKDLLNGEQMARLTGHDRRYLVVGAGGASGAATRRRMVYEALDARTDPPAVATRLEDFGLTPEEIRLWTRVFDVLCGRATHVVAVLEDFEGGYVWELGFLFAPSYREKVWVLKRRYPDEAVERERFDNGMAASHVELLLTGERCHEWVDADELRDVVTEVP